MGHVADRGDVSRGPMSTPVRAMNREDSEIAV
jgi:hypothetical protein